MPPVATLESSPGDNTLARPHRDDYLFEYSAEHLYYEVRMFQEMADRLAEPASGHLDQIAPPPPSEVQRSAAETNALIESFMIHLRALVEFLLGENAQATSVLAADFCTG